MITIQIHWGYLIAALALLFLTRKALGWLAWHLFRFDKRIQSAHSQKKSAEVRLGKISESLAPILNGFPVDIKKPGTSTVFLGQPVDFLHFDQDSGVYFIEVKSGGSRLSKNQQAIKRLIEAGNVKWCEFRVGK